MTLTDSQRDLPPIGRLVGFQSGRQSMYQRVMVAVLRTHLHFCLNLLDAPC